MESKNHDEAIGCYSNALLLGPMDPGDLLVKRSEARAVMGSWEEALIDADKVCNVFNVTSNGT